MKRFSALFLSSLLLIATLVSPVLAENAPNAQAASPSGPSEDVAIPNLQKEISDREPPERAPTTEVHEISAVSVQNAPAANPAVSLRFQDLQTVLKKYNSNLRALDASIADIKTNGTGDLELAVNQMEYLRDNISNVLDSVTQAAAGAPQDQKLIYQGLSMSMGVSLASIRSQISTMQNQIDNVNTTLKTTKNTLINSINQILKGAETLYIGIVTMEASLGSINRGIAALDRVTAITKKQVELGMASAYDLETVSHQRAQAENGLETLKFQIKTSKLTLENMCGMAMQGTVKLEPLPLISSDELGIVNYNENVNEAKGRNVEVMNANIKNDGDDTTHDANGKAYQAAVDTFSYQYQIVCMTVPEKNRLVNAAQEAVDYQKRTFEIAEKKYSMGMISHEEFLSAQDKYKNAQDDLFTAQLNLFTAYRNYIWATTQGIV